MVEQLSAERTSSLSIQAARNLANTHKTPPYMTMITPRWLLRLLPWVDLESGIFRVNRVRVVGEELVRVAWRIGDEDKITVDAAQLRAIPLFQDVGDDFLDHVASHMTSMNVAAGTDIIREGDTPHGFFIVARGRLEVYQRAVSGGNATLSMLGEGDYFGEIGLLKQVDRTASVRSITPCLLLTIDRDTFDGLVREDPVLRSDLESRAQARIEGRREVNIGLMSGQGGEHEVTHTYVDYDPHPREYILSTVQTTLRAHTVVTDLFRQPMDQLKEQLRLVIEAIRERQEWEIINNPDFGLVHNVRPWMRLPTRTGPPTPDDLDELLARVWKEPAFFLAHPKAIAAFGRECTARGVPPPAVNVFGAPFLTWRGVPLVPCDKLLIDDEGGSPRSKILLMRVGAERQGVVGLHQTSIGDPSQPSLAIRLNGVDEKGVASYLVTLYFSAAVLTDDAIGCLESVEIGNYHDYAD